MTQMRITGAKEMEKVLKQLPDHIARRVLKSAVMAGAKVIQDEAIANAPIGTREKTDWKGRKVGPGILKRSIKRFEIKESDHSVTIGIGIKKGSRAFYGRFLEFGTSKLAARPWLRPAFDTKAPEALAKMGKALGKGIERAAKKLAGPYLKSGLRRR